YEKTFPLVVVQSHHFVREIPDDQAGPATPVIIRSVRSHSRSGDSCFAERDSCGHAYVGESAVAFVAVQLVRLRVVCDKQVHPSVAVVINQRHSERLRCGIVQSRPLGHVLERAVSFVVVQRRAVTLIRFRRAIGLVLAVQSAMEVLVDGPFDVVADKQVQLSILVVIEPNGARGESGIVYAGPSGNVLKLAVALIAEQMIRTEAGYINVYEAVIVVVGDRTTKPVHFDRKPCLAGHVGKSTVTVVVVKRGIRLLALMIGPVHRIDQQDVLPTIVVVVQERASGSNGFGQELLAVSTAVVLELNPCLRGNVGKSRRTGVARRFSWRRGLTLWRRCGCFAG